MTAIQTHPVDTIRPTFLPAVLAGSLCSTCGQATVCASCNRCHYGEDVDLPCGGSNSQRSSAHYPHGAATSDDNRRVPVPLLAGGQGGLPPASHRAIGLFEPEENESNSQMQPSLPVDPDIPTNFDDLTDDELAELIRSLLTQAAVLYQSGSLLGDRRQTPPMYSGVFVTPVAQPASLFSISQEGGAK